MKKIVKYSLEDGNEVLVEVGEVDEPNDDRIALSEGITKATQTFETALENIKPVANAIISKLSSLSKKPDEVEVKFGVKMTASMGAIIASGSAEINYEITLKWKQESKNASTP